ncbi:MAG: hypothetical protein ACOC0P_07815, partial [Planctomycetota bacterium]
MFDPQPARDAETGRGPNTPRRPGRNRRSSGSGLMLLAAAMGFASFSAAAAVADVTPDPRMLRYPDVSKDAIVFSYANNLWVVSREG